MLNGLKVCISFFYYGNKLNLKNHPFFRIRNINLVMNVWNKKWYIVSFVEKDVQPTSICIIKYHYTSNKNVKVTRYSFKIILFKTTWSHWHYLLDRYLKKWDIIYVISLECMMVLVAYPAMVTLFHKSGSILCQIHVVNFIQKIFGATTIPCILNNAR